MSATCKFIVLLSKRMIVVAVKCRKTCQRLNFISVIQKNLGFLQKQHWPEIYLVIIDSTYRRMEQKNKNT